MSDATTVDTAADATPVETTEAAEGTDTGSGTPVVAGEAAAAPAPVQTFTVGGQKYTLAELEAHMTGAQSLQQSLKQMAQQKAELEAGKSMFSDRNKLRAFLKSQNISAEELAEGLLVDSIEEDAKTPQDRELEELRAIKADRDAAAKAKTEADEKARHEGQMNQLRTLHENQYLAAAKAHYIPATAEAFIELTQLVMDGLDAGVEVTPDDAARLYRVKHTEANKTRFKGMSADELEASLPEEAVQALIKKHQAKLRAADMKAPDSRTARAAAPKGVQKPSGMTLDELLKKNYGV